MTIITIILIAIGLSMDSFAVSLSNGLSISNLKRTDKFVIPFFFAFFHIMMILAGWYLGSAIDVFIKEIDHWFAFILLFLTGAKMIYESLKKNSPLENKKLSYTSLTFQAFATSIDAFAVGISFAFLDIQIFLSTFVIALITIIMSAGGLFLGNFFGKNAGKYVEVIGGLILIIIGIKIVIEHVYF